MILVLDAALAGCCAAVVDGIHLRAERSMQGTRGQVAGLPAMARDVLGEARLDARSLAAVVVTVGPGSFTGLRAALALAHGIGLAAGIPVQGVTVGDAMRADAPAHRPVWVAIDTRRGLVFLDRDGSVASVALSALPTPPGAVAIGGDAAIAVASRLAARGSDVMLLPGRRPTPLGIAAAALLRPRPAQPLYVDPPDARPGPASRPAPV